MVNDRDMCYPEYPPPPAFHPHPATHKLHTVQQYGIFEAHPASPVLHSACAVKSSCKFVVCTRAGELFEVSRDRCGDVYAQLVMHYLTNT